MRAKRLLYQITLKMLITHRLPRHFVDDGLGFVKPVLFFFFSISSNFLKYSLVAPESHFLSLHTAHYKVQTIKTIEDQRV